MSDYDPTELLVVCDSILEDGEISGDEAYALASWLNEHKEACDSWPGDILVILLREIWADGKVTKTELRQLGRMLIRIRKESVKRQTQKAANAALETASELVRNFDLSEAFLPLIPWTAEIKSHSERGLRYQVDLSLPCCTCPDFQTKRQSLPVGHLTRCCKHVFDAYRQVMPADECPGWLGAFIGNGWPPHPSAQWVILPFPEGHVLASTAPTGWSNVYAAHGREFGRYGYNLMEGRWSYGEEPEHAEYIAGAIQRLCRS